MNSRRTEQARSSSIPRRDGCFSSSLTAKAASRVRAGSVQAAFALAVLIVAAASNATAAAQSVQIAGADQTLDADNVELRGLDTLNGTTREISVKVGETVRYGHLEISVETCRVPRSDPAGDAYAFLRIRDIREAEPRFAGWMFASSPALSALDHPRYDIWVESCSIS